MNEYEHCYITVGYSGIDNTLLRFSKEGWELAAAIREDYEFRLFFRRKL